MSKKRDILFELTSRVPELKASSISEDRQKMERLLKVNENFTYFCDYYLPEYFSCPPAKYQKILYSIIQNRSVSVEDYEALSAFIPEEFRSTFSPSEELEGVADIEPRGHGKSTRWTFAYPLWQILTKRARFVVITSSDTPSAKLQLEQIKTELEGNEKILEDFGTQRVKGNTWNKSSIKIANGAMLSAFGKGAAMRGIKNKQYRPDLVIIDDAFKDNDSESYAMRQKVHNWFNRTVLGLGDTKTLYVMVNTITHNDDLASRTLKEIEDKKKKAWIGIRLSAEVKEGEPLWPERYSWQWLKNKQSSIGSVAYAQEFLSKALSEEDRLFKKSWIKYISNAEIPSRLKKYEGIDPATGAHDLSAVVDIGISEELGKIIVLGSHGKKESTEQFKQRLFARYKTYRYKKAAMEGVAFQTVYKNEIIRDGVREGLFLPIKAMPSGRGSKAQRLMMLSPLIENGTIVFAPGNEDLISQLLDFPTGRFDDLPDALYYAMKIAHLKDFDNKESEADRNLSKKELRRILNI